MSEETPLAAAARLRETGRLAEAQAVLEQALDAAPGDPPTLAALAHLQAQQGDLPAADATLGRLQAAAPGSVPALVLQGRLAAMRGDARRAVDAFDTALSAQPHLPLWKPLAQLHMTLGDVAAAEAAFRQAVNAEGGDRDLEALVGLAATLRRLGRGDEATGPLRRAVELAPDNFSAWLNLAGGLAEVGAGPEAEKAWRRAAELQPDSLEAQQGLAEALAAKGDAEAARAILAAMQAREPRLDRRLQAAMLQPVIAASVAEIDAARARFSDGLAEAIAAPGRLEDPSRLPTTFYLAYQARDDRPLMAALDTMLSAKAPELSYASPDLARRVARGPAARPKIAIVSQFLFNHTVGRLFRGLIEQLDRTRFELAVAHLPGARRDAVKAAIDAAAEVVLELPEGLGAQRAALEGFGPDLILFPDIGMDTASYLLARSRLAPAQAVAWGHPDTTGLASVDYYVSWDLAEPPGAEAHYAERLIRLPRLSCYAEPRPPARRLGRGAQGLPETGALYGVLQSLFKLHPDFDAVLAGIVTRDPDGWLVFTQGGDPNWEALLRRRWAAHPGLNDRALLLPRRPSDAYMSLLAEMDVQLDPVHFGSGNTFYDAMALGAPMITWPGAFARGRIVAAAYAQMDAGQGLIAPTLADYAGLAVAVAHDPDRGALQRELQAAAAAQMFRDAAAVRGLEAFFAAAVDAARAGAHLPSGWTP
jgi:predicted O-linked N-acetylglucosamine transferase (SPINDLY family)